MSELQVLVSTMHQTDLSKYAQMNLQTDAVIANQADRNEILTEDIKGCNVQMVTTSTRGLSRNRNIALSHLNQNAKYILFADDDLVFVDGYEQVVIDEIEKFQDVDAVKFNLYDLSSVRKVYMRKIEKFEKATRRNMSSSGVCGLVVKADILRNYNLHFHENFGAGTENYSGEDTIFLMEMLKKKIKLYRSPVNIAGIDQTESTWYEGHNEKYFTTAGMVIGTIYPKLAYLIVIRSAYKAYKRNDSGMPFLDILRCYYNGIKHHV